MVNREILYEHYAEQARQKLRAVLSKISGNRCACCRKRARRFVLDHCHTTGIVRGAICHRCNNGLGMFGDNTDGLIKAIEYLQNPVDQHFLQRHPPNNWHSPQLRNREKDQLIGKRRGIAKKQRRKKAVKEPAEPSFPSPPPKLYVVR